MAIENQVTFAEVGNPKRVTQLTENTDVAGAYFLTEKVGESAAKKTSYATVESAVKSKVQSEYLQTLSVTPASDKTMSEKLVVGELKKRDDKIVQLEQQQNEIIETSTRGFNNVTFTLGRNIFTDLNGNLSIGQNYSTASNVKYFDLSPEATQLSVSVNEGYEIEVYGFNVRSSDVVSGLDSKHIKVYTFGSNKATFLLKDDFLGIQVKLIDLSGGNIDVDKSGFNLTVDYNAAAKNPELSNKIRRKLSNYSFTQKSNVYALNNSLVEGVYDFSTSTSLMNRHWCYTPLFDYLEININKGYEVSVYGTIEGNPADFIVYADTITAKTIIKIHGKYDYLYIKILDTTKTATPTLEASGFELFGLLDAPVVDVTNHGIYADNATPISDKINSLIYDLWYIGGGTVFIPANQSNYILDKSIRICSNITIKADKGATFFLKEGSNCPMVQNYNIETLDSQWRDKNISIDGGNWDGNKNGQTHTLPNENWVVGFYFAGVDGLDLRNLTISNATTFGMLITNIVRYKIDNIYINHPLGFDIKPDNQDGIHINGPAYQGLISNIYGHTWDDMIALNADDGGTFGGMTTFGNIIDCVINNVVAVDCLNVVRLLSANHRIDGIFINNVVGRCHDVGFEVSAYGVGEGNFENVHISNVDIKYIQPKVQPGSPAISLSNKIKYIKLSNITFSGCVDDRPLLIIQQNCNIQKLIIDSITADNSRASATTLIDNAGKIDNLLISNVAYNSSNANANDRLLRINNTVKNLIINNVVASNIRRFLDIENATVSNLSISSSIIDERDDATLKLTNSTIDKYSKASVIDSKGYNEILDNSTINERV